MPMLGSTPTRVVVRWRMLAQRYRDEVADSRLSTMPEATLALLTSGSTVLDVPSGGVLLRLGSTDPFLCLVATGLVRTSWCRPMGGR